MAEASTSQVTFDLIDGYILDNNESFLDNLTTDEQTELDSVVTLLESAKEDSMEQFEPDENSNCHKQVNDSELDHLAGKNSAQSATYQTKWAVVVMKDKYCSDTFSILAKITRNMIIWNEIVM